MGKMIFFLLLATGILSEDSRISKGGIDIFTGKAVSTKSGPGLILDDGSILYLKEKQEWEPIYANKRLSIQGKKVMEEQKHSLKNEKGEYSGGLEGSIPYLVDYKNPEVKKSISIILVWKKNVSEKTIEKQMENLEYPYWEGMDGSRGKTYYYKTGKKFIIIFPTEKEKEETIQKISKNKSVYEIYTPDWKIQKD